MESREIPTIVLEQWVLDELPKHKEDELIRTYGREYLEGKKAEIEHSNRELLSWYPPNTFREDIERRVEGKESSAFSRSDPAQPFDLSQPSRRTIPFSAAEQSGQETEASKKPQAPWRRITISRLAGPLAAAAAFAVVLIGILQLYTPEPEEATRAKGMRPHLIIYRQGKNEPQLLHEGDIIEENDVLQIRYVPAGKPFGTIFTIDGWGNVTLLYPESMNRDTGLEAEKSEFLDFGYQLDDAPGFERFFFVTSDKEFNPERILEKAREFAQNTNQAKRSRLSLPKGFEQASILLRKKEQ